MQRVRARAGTCKAYDPLSGLASCKVFKRHTIRRGVSGVQWRAVATDKAGNVDKEFGFYR